jgi:hypothetical protein
MGIEAIDHNDAGALVVPETWGEWDDWVSATATRNWCDEDPLLDWLTRYGVERGFVPDTLLPGYDERLDFTRFLFAQGLRFEAAVLAHLETLVPLRRIARGGDPSDVRSIDRARETFAAMSEGVPAIVQGVLRNPETRTYGAADLLVRSDVLAGLFPASITPDEAAVPAPDLGGPWHYRVVDIKFTTLHLDRVGHAASGHLKFMAQVYVYNEALGRLQGYLPPFSYLLGRGWEKGQDRGQSCMERLAPIPHERALRRRDSVGRIVAEAVEWMRRLRTEGGSWEVLPEPSVPELRPNAGNGEDQPWHAAKLQIARQLEELTLLWQVGVKNRRLANAEGIFRWTDPRCTASTLAVTGEKKPDILDRIIAVNQSTGGSVLEPVRVHASEDAWRPKPALEFYVDFETVTNLADDFTRVPEQNGQPLIFMVGCGHVEDGEWQFRCFIANQLSEPAEATMLDEWFAHMDSVTDRLTPGHQPNVIHWSPAETSSLETAYRSATERHPEKHWPRPNWFDFLKKVVKEEPVVVRGAMGFGLKAVANAMHSHGLIETGWPGGVVDGLGAMLGAWRSAEEARDGECTLPEVPLMQAIRDYNEIDCKVMMEIVAYLRANH